MALQRGETLERLGCSTEALLVYGQALASAQDERTTCDTSRLLHRVGICALDLGDGPRAFASLLEAGRRARDLGLRRHCAESLAAAGWALALHPVATSVDEAVNGDLVAAAFADVIEEVRRVLLVDGTPSLEQAMIVHSNFAGLTVLAAEACLDEVPSRGADVLFHEVLVPFSDRYNVSERTTVDDVTFIAFVTRALARLCRDLAEWSRQRRAGTPPTEEAVTAMIRLVADAFARDLREPVLHWLRDLREPVLHWLGDHLRNRHGAEWATDDHIATLAGQG